MAEIKKVEHAKYFCGALVSSSEFLPLIEEDLTAGYGDIDIIQGPFPWDFTGYYKKQMGSGLEKIFYSFSELRSRADLAGVKIFTNELEKKYADSASDVPRPVNLDPGYITPSSMILASAKDYAHRIYLDNGIYAQVDYFFTAKNEIEFLPWTYPDYKTDEYKNFFLRMRQRLLEQLKGKK